MVYRRLTTRAVLFQLQIMPRVCLDYNGPGRFGGPVFVVAAGTQDVNVEATVFEILGRSNRTQTGNCAAEKLGLCAPYVSGFDM